ncbi:MAG TPA: hypothetical protein P5044_07930, partial [bacterium]|nr:hypothetical protein [bacterium]
DGTNYLVVWVDTRGSSSSIYGSRVSVNGEILDPAGIFIAENVYDSQQPSVAFDGTNYLIVWESFPVELEYIMGYYESRLLGARVGKNGKILDADAFEISKVVIGYRDQSPEVVFNGSSFMVVWTARTCEYDNSPPHPSGWSCYQDRKGVNVLKDGTVSEKSVFEIKGASDSGIACGKSNCLFVWREDYDSKITGILLSGKFDRVGSGDILITESAYTYDFPPSVAFDGENYMVFWSEDYGHSINGVRITDDGVLLDKGTRINYGANDPNLRDVVFDGENYLLVWEGGRSADSSRLDIYGASVATDGTVLCEEDMIFSADEAQEAAPAVASSGDGKSIIVYQHFDERNNFNTYRIAARLVDPDINAFSDWDNAKPDEDFENPIIDEDAENIGDYDIFSPNSDGDEIESDEDSFLDLDAGPDDDTTDSEKKGSGCSITIFAN